MKRRALDFTFRQLLATDTAVWLDLLSAVGLTRPFLIEPPYDTEAPVWVSLLAWDRTADSEAPEGQTVPKYRLRGSMAEWVA